MANTADIRARGQPIAVIGSGCRFPGGANTPSKLWDLLKAPKDLLSKIPKERFNVDAFYHPDGTHHGRTNVQNSYFLSENVQAFDASFFNITPSEADCVDPQHRLLLETVYESLCTAGQKLENLQGSSTAVYVGLMCSDYADVLAHDLDSAPAYTATGSSGCILSNRVSYFFDWHGPSMTIDTACSSSLVAVHQAVQCLRSGDSKVAVAAGANLIFGPLNYVIESSLGMLSPHGRSRMWDAAADGYARGEGVAALVLKTLDQALHDGDHIECIIRETGVNQDGRSAGITMPSHALQEQLIRDTYAKAGLDLRKASDRCQYFEAHGTGTPAGDPQEAEAIASAFFGSRKRSSDEEHLYVGSIKTVIGHTEGTAGIAGLLKASLAVQNATIPPNMLFENLSPKVEPFYNDVRILTTARPWPDLVTGAPRRASVNSFGFGGTNAHAIIESYNGPQTRTAQVAENEPSLMPIVLSANSERALKATMEGLLQYLTVEPDTNMQDLVWTLLEERSVLSVRRAFAAQTVVGTRAGLEREIAAINGKQGLTTKSEHKKRKPKILGIFTGQGAQWSAMGKVLIESIRFAREIVEELDHSLATLPSKYRPSWTLFEQLMLEGDSSNVKDATFSQPLCTAIQIVLIELLTSAGLTFKTVVGHSSGEIACAFAAGYITAAQAIRIAYLRGWASRLASSASGMGGAMLAAGTTFDDALDLCALEMFQGRVCVAASNAPDSVTLSGDTDAIEQVKIVLEDESKFARPLKVDKAYHSHHMLPCVRTYVQALIACGCANEGKKHTSDVIWLSSVYSGKCMTPDDVKPDYWKANLVSPVLFSQAVELALIKHTPLDAAIEVGCHPALKGPCLSTMQNAIAGELPYTGCMQRDTNDIDAFSNALGYLWEHFGAAGMDINAFNALLSPKVKAESLAKLLPQYTWDNHKTFWVSSRSTRAFLNGDAVPHPLLGKLSSHSTASALQWHNFIRPRDISWLEGHQLQGQTVFPGAAYAVMAMEAAKHIAGDREIRLLEVLDLKIGKAITFDDEHSLVEVNLTVDLMTEPGNAESIVLRFNCDSCLAKESSLSWSAGGTIVLTCGPHSANVLPAAAEEPAHMTEASVERFYNELDLVGYGYTKDFRGLTSIKRSTGQSCGTIKLARFDEDAHPLMLHPATLDVAFQAFIGAFCAPGDGRLRSLHVPVSIARIAVNPWLSAVAHSSSTEVLFNSTISGDDSNSISGEVEVFVAGSRSSIIQIEQISFKPFSPPTSADDKLLFSKWVWAPLNPDRILDDTEQRATNEDTAVARQLERILYFYLRTFLTTLFEEDRLLGVPSQSYIRWAEHVMMAVAEGQNIYYDLSWDADEAGDIQLLCEKLQHRADVRLFRRVGEHLADITREDENVFEVMNHDGLLTEFYEKCLGCPQAYHYLGKLVGQLTHRYPNMDILEIGAGTGGATKHVLKSAGTTFNNFTFTDISSGFFDEAQKVFAPYEDRLDFKSLDITRKVGPQGFKEHSYDMIIASNVLHATPSLEETLSNVRSLLKPGGHLLFLELTNPRSNRAGFVFGLFPDWWAGESEGRELAPFVTVERWNSLLQETGFSSIDTRTADSDADVFALSVFSAHAVDNRMKRLDEPLSLATEESSSEIVVVGGSSGSSSSILEGLQNSLPYRHFRSFARLQDMLDQHIEPHSTFVILSELESEVFAHLNEDNFEGLKAVIFHAKNILWLTDDAWTQHPYQAMIIGLLRTLRLENADINIQSLDVDGVVNFNVEVLVKQVLRLEAERGQLPEGLLWTTEPELRYSQGRLFVPRLTPDASRNNRYNSAGRIITATVDVNQAAVVFKKTQEEVHFELERKRTTVLPKPVDKVRLRVHYSLPKAIRIGNLGYFYLVQGQTFKSDMTVVALSRKNASSVEVRKSWIKVLSQQRDSDRSVLLHLAAELLAHAILSCVAPGASLLLLEPHVSMTEPLLRRASRAGTQVRFAAVLNPAKSYPTGWITLHEKESVRMLGNVIPDRCSSFFDLSRDQCPMSVARRLASSLPACCKKYDSDYLFQDEAATLCGEEEDTIGQFLEDAVAAMSEPANAIDPISAANIASGACQIEASTVIDWNDIDTVPVHIQPIDSSELFGSDRTYLLVGLAGDLGRSLCLWMIKHGARHVVLTSRNPKVDPRWIEDMANLGANVKLQSMNVLHRDSLVSGLAEIQQQMPIIGGIAFGPLVLQDALFENMDLETMQSVLEPKVEGARHLNDLFFDHDLDFFVMFSSLVMVGGNPGQSNYSAANAYMRTIAAQRRQRGLAASCINIGAITGVGFLAKAAREEDYSISKYMFPPLAEQDLHTQFAEAVISGSVDATDDFELMTGMPYMDPVYREHLPFFDDPRLGLYRLPDQQKKSSAGANSRARPVRERLLEARSMDEAHNFIKDALTEKLRAALAIPSDDSVDTETPLIDQGVDSLVAVAIRTWFSKQLDLDVPVLKVLGGASIIDLVDDAVDKLPPSSIPLVDWEATSQEAALPILSSAGEVASAPTPEENYRDDSSETSTTVPSTSLSDDEFSQGKLSDLSTPPTGSSLLDGGQEMKDPFEAILLAKKLEGSEGLQRTEVMSFGQARFWLMRKLVQDPTTFNVTVGLWMEGLIDLERLARAVHSATQRHETFRTRFFDEDGRPDRPMQAIMKKSRVRFEDMPVKDKSAALEGFKGLERHIYNIETGDTARIVYLHWSRTEGFLVICYHHIISDGWSYELLFNEIDKIYRGQIMPTPPQYADYAIRQRHEFEAGDMDADIAYWESQYQTLPPVLPLLPLSAASTRLRPVAWDYHEASFRLQPMVAARIRDRSRKHKANSIHFYLAAFQVLLARLSGSTDFSIGLSDANRSTLEDLATLGFFINLLPIRLEYSANQTFGEAIGQARIKVREALLHAKVPFDVLLQRLNIPRASTHAPIFQAGFDYRQGQAESGTLGDAVLTGVELSRSRAAMDIMVEVMDDPKRDPKITFKLQSSIYANEDVQVLLKSYVSILATFSRNPALRVEEPRLFARGDVEQAMQLGKGFIMENTWQPTLLARIHDQCNSIPDHAALRSEGISISYREMAHTINGLANTLISHGITPGAKIVSLQKPTPTWVCSMLAIMQTGATYVPIDPSLPQARLSAIIEDCKPAVILINDATIAQTVLLGSPHSIINVNDVRCSEAAPDCLAVPEQPCAILYTSGTTGTPKGHMLSHASVLNNVDGTISMLGTEPLHMLQHSALTFDMSIWQPLLGLASGGYVFVVPQEDRRDSRRISQLIAENDVSCMVATPLEYASWMQVGSDYLARASGWKYALTGGEALTHAVLHNFRDLNLPQLRVFNSYGPAEICFYSHAIEIAYKDNELPARVPIGMPMPNYSAYIVDEKLRPVAAGWPGEILIGGLGVGLGYLNQPELTANAFIPDTFASTEQKARGFTTLFRSGDRGRLRSDGALLFDGRLNGGTQIKLRGIRIELQDIEACIVQAANGALSDAVVGVRGEGAARFLVAHVVFSLAHSADQRPDFLRNLRASLAVPNYMRPALLVELESLPTGRHAKVDRAALASMALPSNVGGMRSTAALTVREQELWQLWRDVLPEEAIADLTPDAETDFIGVGGNSILIVQLHALLQESIGRRMPLVDLFESTTLCEMADRVDMLVTTDLPLPQSVLRATGA